MLQLLKRYRQNYAGEDIISQRVYENGEWTTTTENVPNHVINNQISNRAMVFGNGVSRLDIDVEHLQSHKSGLLGSATVQIYACNAFYRDYIPDFLVVTDRNIAKEISDSGYVRTNIVYTRVDITLEFPKKFYLIPYDPYADAGTTALYLACFDGHKKVYLSGFDGQDTPSYNNNVYAGTDHYEPLRGGAPSDDTKWVNNQASIFNLYNDVDFAIVSKTGKLRMPESWKYCTNLRQINLRQFALEADL